MLFQTPAAAVCDVEGDAAPEPGPDIKAIAGTEAEAEAKVQRVKVREKDLDRSSFDPIHLMTARALGRKKSLSH